MTLLHDIPMLNIVIPSPVWGLNGEYMAKLSRLVKRAQQTRRSTNRRWLNIRSAMSTRYAMALLRRGFGGQAVTSRIETTRFGERAIGQLTLAGLEIS